jgi:hypothetical protein
MTVSFKEFLGKDLQTESYDRNKMMQLSVDYTKLKKSLDAITEKYGVKKGQILMVSQLDSLKKKMTPADLKSYEDLQKKIVKNQSETAKMTNEPRMAEKYPLGGRDEKSARSYSN